MHNLGTVEQYRKSNSSYPGCWAYADMLQVGVRNGLSIEETRSHFGGWAIVSSPLTLSHDVNDDDIMDSVWDIISNREILAVNQGYFGDSGGIYHVSNETVVLKHGKYETEVPIYQYLSKPLETNRVAVLLMNSGETTQVLNATFATIPGLDDGIGNGNKYLVRDLWAHKDMGVFKNSVSVPVDSHDASFLLIQKMDSLNTTIS